MKCWTCGKEFDWGIRIATAPEDKKKNLSNPFCQSSCFRKWEKIMSGCRAKESKNEDAYKFFNETSISKVGVFFPRHFMSNVYLHQDWQVGNDGAGVNLRSEEKYKTNVLQSLQH